LNVACGVVFSACPPHVPTVIAALSQVRQALEHGCLVYLLAHDDAVQAHLLEELRNYKGGHLDEIIRSRTGQVEVHECAEVIARHRPGPYSNQSLDILPDDLGLDAEAAFLVRRAFSDCATVVLESLTGGRSATTYAVHATLKASEVGPRPMPFFMKIDAASKILAERRCYELYASNHIPWYLRPNLEAQRCVTGTEKGVLVGSFVDGSHSLWQAILDGKGTRQIHALFEDTLMGWRSQAYRREPSTHSIAGALQRVFDWRKVKPEHVATARELRKVYEPKVAWERLLNLPEQRWRAAPIHGDLHPENVRVRGSDSIIIDLANVHEGPLCADLASFEVWVAFQVPEDAKKLPKEAAWVEFVEQHFSPENIDRPPGMVETEHGLHGLRACLRETRMIANSIRECASEYAIVTAIQLLRRACYASDGDLDRARRGRAYALGCGIIEALSERGSLVPA